MKLRIDSKSIKFKMWLYFILFAAVLIAALWILQVFLFNNLYGTMKTSQTKSVVKNIEDSFNSKSNEEFLEDVAEISDSYDMYIYVVSYDGQETYFSPSEDNYAMTPGFDMPDAKPQIPPEYGSSDGDYDGSKESGDSSDIPDKPGSKSGNSDGKSGDTGISPNAPSQDDSDNPPEPPQGQKYNIQLRALNEEIMKSNGESVSMSFKGSDASQNIFAYGKILKRKNSDKSGSDSEAADTTSESISDDLIVYVFSPLWPISSTVKILMQQLVMVTIISLLVACLISFYLSMRISRPIRRIDSTAKRLANGEYGIVFKGGHYTELNNLASTLTGASIELEKSDVMQKDLIANVSHDLKTPLTMIKSYAEMIRDLSGDNPEKRAQHLKVIIDESDRLNGLVEDLLTVSRAQSGKIVLQPSLFCLNDVVNTILDTYKVMEIEKGYSFNFEPSENFIIEGDEDKIKQVVANLISNATKFCNDNKTVDITLKKHGHAVKLRVRDYGIGIPEDEIDHIWERYYRASVNGKRSVEGSGLGLAICKEILTLHKYDFGVESTVGEGTTFWFDAELAKDKSAKERKDQS